MKEANVNRPTLVVLTPVRNEAWILRAFLKATSLWADHILIADQISTDGSREIAQSFPKVTLIDNDRKEMHQAATRRLLFEESKKIPGDKILFALDADEFLAGDFIHSDDWRKILESNPDDAFCWRWMNLKKDDIRQYSSYKYYYWAIHEAESLWEGAFPDNFIHEWRLPWPPNARTINLDELRSLHFARVNQVRQQNKERFYQVSTMACQSSTNPIKLFRLYHAEDDLEYYPVPEDAYCYYRAQGIDLLNCIDFKDEGKYYTESIKCYFNQQGISRFAFLDIWDKEWMEKNDVKDPRRLIHRLIHRYLSKTNSYRNYMIVKVVDSILGLFIK